MSALSEIQICNLALSHIGHKAEVEVIDPPGDTVEELHCSRFYPVARDVMLEAHAWTFARRRVALAALEPLENGEWGYAYELPTAHMRALKVVPPGAAEDHPGENFVIETQTDASDSVLYTNVAEARLHYIFRETNTGRYSSTAAAALALLLGSYLAGPIVKGKVADGLQKKLFQIYLATLAEAKALDASQRRESKSYADHVPKWMSDR